MEQTYLYEVRPHRIITGIHGVPYIRSPRSVYLTKEEVLICLQNGSVYRRFANLDKLERVTVTNVDRLHNENFIPEEEWKTECLKKAEAPVEEAPVIDEPTKQEEVVEEAPAVEEPEVAEEDSKVDETAPVEVAEEPAEVEEAEEEVAEEESDDSVVEEKVDEAPQQNNNGVQFKNHHKKHKK